VQRLRQRRSPRRIASGEPRDADADVQPRTLEPLLRWRRSSRVEVDARSGAARCLAQRAYQPAEARRLLASANLYDQLREKNPLYLKNLVDSKTIQFFEAYRVAKQLPGKTMEEAADLARRASIDISPDQEDTLKGHYRDHRAASEERRSPRWLKASGTHLRRRGAPVNAGYVQQQVIDNAKLFARLGLGPRDASSRRRRPSRKLRQMATAIGRSPSSALNCPATSRRRRRLRRGLRRRRTASSTTASARVTSASSYDGAGTFTLVNRTAWDCALRQASRTSR
jgi:hypothetical protein